MTEREHQELCARSSAIATAPEARRVAKPKAKPVEPVSGPLSVTLVLYGHCPSKKNCWTRGGSGKMFLPEEVAKQITILTQQAMFAWKYPAPVEHPDLTITFYVRDARRDRDGILVTILDCLQEAGVLVNDNLARANGRLILESAVFVKPEDERVEILICKV